MFSSINLNRSWSDYKKQWAVPFLFCLLAFPWGAVVSPLLVVMIYYVPCIYYKQGKAVTLKDALGFLGENFSRIVIAGVLQAVAISIGYLLLLIPGMLISFATPLVISRIVNTDDSGVECVTGGIKEFLGGLKTKRMWVFSLIQIIIGVGVSIASVITCGIGTFVAIPLGAFCLYGYMNTNNFGNNSRNILTAN
tara:strand:+ start:385 stop:966 length:582 start_codon:yes stop_codon:yes gene_type:complete